ncbi:MAG: Gfo/Idh/MocA family oxidoreductase [Ignavibacteriales bacterium]|nr:Gfo/Idh/MocA family oxidoreductase [Ignavibacteriales bacterium]
MALGDPFQDRVDELLKTLQEKVPAAVKVTAGDAASPASTATRSSCAMPEASIYIVTAAPPGFRPLHLKAAVEAGKHVFMEKPVAVDPVGVRSVIATSELAAKKGLAIVAGTQRRHQKRYLETHQAHPRRGQIGEIVGGAVLLEPGRALGHARETAEMSEMEWQCRNWLYFSWTSGDHIVEQHVHNIDVVNWAIGADCRQDVVAHGRAPGPDGPRIRQHLRPLRRRVRVPERRPGGQPVPPDQGLRRPGRGADRRHQGRRLRLRRDHRARSPGSSRPRSPIPTSSGAHRPHRERSGPASPSTRAGRSPRARCAPSWAG